jgi:hypothetical protein
LDKIGTRLITSTFDTSQYFLVKAISYNLFCTAHYLQNHFSSVIICDSSPPIYISFNVFRI